MRKNLDGAGALAPAQALAPAKALALVACVALAAACAPTIKPTASPDPEAACPAGRRAWRLEIVDQRAERQDSPRLVALLRDSLSRSFPGCTWTSAPGDSAIRIEIHRFSVRFNETWDAAADWSVIAVDPSGRTLTEFQSTAEVSRPNYRASNNEREALQQAFDQALSRTLAGLRAVPSAG